MQYYNLKIVKVDELEGVKVGLHVPSNDHLYVSPALYRLMSHKEDMEVLRKKLRILTIPLDSAGNEMFSNVHDWIKYLKEHNDPVMEGK
jgi:hypothetical protein